MSVHPLDLPFVRLQIASCLTRHDQVACASVSRAWHRTFGPLFWRDIHFCPATMDPQVMRPRAGWIRTLSYDSFDNQQQFSLGKECRFLEKLSIKGSMPTLCRLFWTRCAALIEQNKDTLGTIELLDWWYWKVNVESDAGIWQAIEQCSRLKHLVITGTRVSDDRYSSLGRILPRLESLRLEHVHLWIPENPSVSVDSALVYPAMRRLEMVQFKDSFPQDTTPSSQLQTWIRQCPRLEFLAWHVTDTQDFPALAFLELVEANTWPDLTSIDLLSKSTPLQDSLLATLINSVGGTLSRVRLAHSAFGRQATLALSRHFLTLQDLDLDGCLHVSSAMVHAFLSSCPSLKRLCAMAIHGREILDPSSQQWVCCSWLEELRIYIDLSVAATTEIPVKVDQKQQRHVFKRLATLKELLVLDLRFRGEGLQTAGSQRVKRTLTTCPEYGVEYLLALTKLEKFYPPDGQR